MYAAPQPQPTVYVQQQQPTIIMQQPAPVVYHHQQPSIIVHEQREQKGLSDEETVMCASYFTAQYSRSFSYMFLPLDFLVCLALSCASRPVPSHPSAELSPLRFLCVLLYSIIIHFRYLNTHVLAYFTCGRGFLPCWPPRPCYRRDVRSGD